MNSKVVTGVVVVVVAVIGVGAVMLSGNKESSQKMSSGENHSSMENKNTDNQAQSSEAQTTDQVAYKNFDVEPKIIKVKKGTTVTWTNEDTAKHDVTPDTETADFKASQLFGKGETYQVTFNTVGKYTYYCSPHPYMKGTVEVTE